LGERRKEIDLFIRRSIEVTLGRRLSMADFRRCNRCIMDDSADLTITFDKEGNCNYCNDALEMMDLLYFPNKIGRRKIDDIISKVKQDSRGKKYDCIMGISGGLDSSYAAYLGYLWGLRILAVHVDDGFDTEISKKNIKKLLDATGIECEMLSPDAKQYNDILKSYMRAGVPNLAAPQDNITIAYVYKFAIDNNIKYFFSGGNFALECILQRGNSHSNEDVVNIKSIHKRYGTTSDDNLFFMSWYKKNWYKIFKGFHFVRPLNYVEYNRDRAFEELKQFCQFEYYGRKHLENIFTAFLQLYWMPKKFGVDKRTSHLSSMIVSGQMTREEALKEYEKPLYDEQMMDQYIQIIKEKLQISDGEFDEIMKSPVHRHDEYKISFDSKIRRIRK